MPPADPFTDEHVTDLQLEDDPVFVIGCDDELDNNSHEDVSTTLTADQDQEQEQEPFETLRHKASELILSLYPSYSAPDVKIKRMQDGEHNRFIGVTLCKTPPRAPWYSTQGIREILQPCLTGRPTRSGKSKHLVLRIPLRRPQDTHHRAAILAYLGLNLEHPVPTGVLLDTSPHNPLGQAYMLQKRLPGQCLSSLWPTLNQAQRLSAVRALSHIILDVRKIRNKCPGRISIRNTTYDIRRDFITVEPVPIPRSHYVFDWTSFRGLLSEPQSTKDFLLDLCARQRAYATVTKLPAACNDLWARISKMVEALHDMGLIPDSSSFHLYHGDLHPRNLLSSIASKSEVEITGITGWDDALFAPAFMSARVPFFLWSGEVDKGGEEVDALIEPEDVELLEAKRVFEGIVGESFLEHAYCPALILARRLWRYLVGGFTNGADIFLVEEIVEEFERLRPLA